MNIAADARDATWVLIERAGPPRRTKRELIVDKCRDRRVLDLGCVQHSAEMSLRTPRRWLHAAICQVATKCVGVDYLDDDVRILNSRGYNVVAADVLVDDPPGRFDVVVAGDLIEHLENPSAFLDYVGRALDPGGTAVITTPNCYYVGQQVMIAGRRLPAINPEHVLGFDPFTLLKLVERSPLRVRSIEWLALSWWPFWDSRRLLVRRGVAPVIKKLIQLVIRRRPYLSSDFAVLLEHRTSDEVGETSKERAARATAFHRVGDETRP